MSFLADLHIHSHFSIATSKDCDPEHLFLWACLKGITLVGTGDFTHPGWREELGQKLMPAEEGLYRLRPEYERAMLDQIPRSCHLEVRFILSAEISSIYKRGGRTRKVHNCILVPSLDDAKAISNRLDKIGNINADGRPILGLDSHDLLEIMLENAPSGIFIPAHIWTPHFSLFGAYSGFDALEECFNDLSGHIWALETGLSSNPPMNWRLSALDRYTLVSNSDAHSPRNLAREANIFDCGLSFSDISNALKNKGNGQFLGTVEFFPEEGKYHYSGHRNCGVRLAPEETRRLNGICPLCGKKLTLGVMHRVVELADRPEGFVLKDAPSFKSIIPLPEVISDYLLCGKNSKKVEQTYFNLLQRLGPEWKILGCSPIDEIRKYAGASLADAIDRIRKGDVIIKPGFDGEYGTISVFTEEDRGCKREQISLFVKREDTPEDSKTKTCNEDGLDVQIKRDNEQLSLFGTERDEGSLKERLPPSPAANSAGGIGHTGGEISTRQRSESPEIQNIEHVRTETRHKTGATEPESYQMGHDISLNGTSDVSASSKMGKLSKGAESWPFEHRLNPQQSGAVISQGGPVLIIAGPGTGKTLTLVSKMAHLISERKVDPERILAITFTNKAAKEINLRIKALLPNMSVYPFIGTFHQFCLWLLRGFWPNPDFIIFHAYDSLGLIEHIISSKGFKGSKNVRDSMQEISKLKVSQWNGSSPKISDPLVLSLYEEYQKGLAKYNAFDYDDLLIKSAELLKRDKEIRTKIQSRFRQLLVDEFQDVNKVQYNLVKLLADDTGTRIFAIGDPNQAIYGFRGADNSLFYKLKKEFEVAQVHILEQNYRSTNQIIQPAIFVISHNPQPAPVKLKAIKGDGPSIRFTEFASEKMEAIGIVKEIMNLMGGIDMLQAHGETTQKTSKGENFRTDYKQGSLSDNSIKRQKESVRGQYTFSDFAILFRTGNQADILEECLLKEGIPYHITGQQGLMEISLIRQILALLRWTFNTSDEYSLITALGLPVFPKSKAICTKIADLLIHKREGLGDFRHEIMMALNSLRAFREKSKESTPSEFINDLINNLKEAGLKKGDEKDIKRLLLLANEFGTMQEFIEGTHLYREGDISWRGKKSGMATEMISLMTIHAAKGLEFPVVFICGCEDGIMPYRHMTGRKIKNHQEDQWNIGVHSKPLGPEKGSPDNSNDHSLYGIQDSDLDNSKRPDNTNENEEERRLFYVGITRAKELLCLTCAKSRMVYGKKQQTKISPFISDIPSEFLIKTDSEMAAPYKKRARQLSLWGKKG